MTYVIAQPCVDVKDRACVDECPVDCIYEGARSLYIHPEECVDCGACEPCARLSHLLRGRPALRVVRLPARQRRLLQRPGQPRRRQKTGVQDFDDPMIAALPPQNEEWKAENL